VFRAVVLALLEAGFPVSALTPGGTALHEAALGGKLEVVRSLLDHGVSLSGRDQGNMTVLEVLAQFPAHLTHEMSALITRHSESWMLSKYQKKAPCLTDFLFRVLLCDFQNLGGRPLLGRSRLPPSARTKKTRNPCRPSPAWAAPTKMCA
jgi:hypothetical protein